MQELLSLDLPAVPDGAVDGSMLLDDAKPLIANGSVASNIEDQPLNYARSCYICKSRFSNLHFFYDQLCPACADINWSKRNQAANLNGYIALVTGGRVKIGFQTSLKLLRNGAHVIVTSRFPRDTAERYSKQQDFSSWKHRLDIYGMDFRDLQGVEGFVDFLYHKYPHIDILINNACQTIRRPPAFYSHLLENESKPLAAIPEEQQTMLLSQSEFLGTSDSKKLLAFHSSDQGSLSSYPSESKLLSAEMSQLQIVDGDECIDDALFPKMALDVNKQQIDLRKRNSWLLKLSEISTPEVLEVFAVNTMTPFILNSKLKSLMQRGAQRDRFIINVSAMEGKFYRHKNANHPHTNMAKAALNMMTRTSGQDYRKDNIFMNAVDTGWINDENPLEIAQNIAERHNFQTPIDEIDAAARILDPILSSINGATPDFGKFFKDYRETEW